MATSTRKTAAQLKREIAAVLASGEGATCACPGDDSRRPTGRARVPEAPRVARETRAADPLPIVREALRSIQGRGRFGDRKIFISELFRQVEPQVGMTLPQFKRWLIDRHMAQDLVLARADLVAAMDPELVSESHIKNDISDFHFVRDPSFK